MVTGDNDLLKKLKKQEGELKKIFPGDKTPDTPLEQNLLTHLKQGMDKLKSPFNKQD